MKILPGATIMVADGASLRGGAALRTRRENRPVSVTVASGLLGWEVVRGDQVASHMLMRQGEKAVGGGDARARR
jgi:hypothetical protein